jgi:hypothetical protein
MEQVTRSSQTAADGRLARMQLEGCLRMRPALEVAEHDWQAKLLRQPRNLLVQPGAPIVVTSSLFARNNGRQVIHLSHQGLLTRAVDTRLDGDPMRDAMQPAPDRIPAPDRAGPANQDQKRRLERILDLGRILQDGSADGQDHRPVPPHQRRERSLVPR